MPINPDSPFALLPEVRRADDIATLTRNLRALQIPHPGGSDCNVIIPENQISAKGSSTITFTAADNQRRVYAPTAIPLWDTGILFGQYLLSGAAGLLYVMVSQPDYYRITFQLDSFSAAGNCQLAIIRNDTEIWHEQSTTITLGNDLDHKAGIMTSGVFAANIDTFKILAWHTGGGTCRAWVTALQLF